MKNEARPDNFAATNIFSGRHCDYWRIKEQSAPISTGVAVIGGVLGGIATAILPSQSPECKELVNWVGNKLGVTEIEAIIILTAVVALLLAALIKGLGLAATEVAARYASDKGLANPKPCKEIDEFEPAEPNADNDYEYDGGGGLGRAAPVFNG